MCHLDTAQCRILKDSGRFLVKIPRGLGLTLQSIPWFSPLINFTTQPFHCMTITLCHSKSLTCHCKMNLYTLNFLTSGMLDKNTRVLSMSIPPCRNSSFRLPDTHEWLPSSRYFPYAIPGWSWTSLNSMWYFLFPVVDKVISSCLTNSDDFFFSTGGLFCQVISKTKGMEKYILRNTIPQYALSL